MRPLTKPVKGMQPYRDITQIFHSGHDALDIDADFRTDFINSYGIPLHAPEDVEVVRIITPFDDDAVESHEELKRGYGLLMHGLETGYDHLYWHTLPILPVNGGDVVKRGNIVAFMGNSGNVRSGGTYVPLEERKTPPYRGTHAHYRVKDGSKSIDPAPLIDWTQDPSPSIAHYLTIIAKTLRKMLKVVKKPNN